jgi:hypothetical protein
MPLLRETSADHRNRSPPRPAKIVGAAHQVTQKGLDLGCAHLARMPQAMMPDERADPVDIGLLGS